LVTPMVNCKTLHEAFMQYEKDGAIGRIDTSRLPKVFKGPIIDKSELEEFRSINDIVRLGRVESITFKLEQGTVSLSSSPADTLFVDCMADLDGTYYGSNFSEDFKIFDGDQINLGLIIVFSNASCSAALIAYIESTFADDEEMRNNLLYFARGKEYTKLNTNTMRFFSQFYYQNKTFKALRAYPPAMEFVMNSRTLLDAPCHHRFGTFGLLWTMFGPAQMAKKVKTFVERVESGDYPDCQDCFGCAGRILPQPNELKIKEKSKVENNYPPPRKK